MYRVMNGNMSGRNVDVMGSIVAFDEDGISEDLTGEQKDHLISVPGFDYFDGQEDAPIESEDQDQSQDADEPEGTSEDGISEDLTGDEETIPESGQVSDKPKRGRK